MHNKKANCIADELKLMLWSLGEHWMSTSRGGGTEPSLMLREVDASQTRIW